jgi:methanogenic corrinoid protein MtbC1
VRSLGRSLPAEQVARAAGVLKPDAVFLSLSMLSRLNETLDVVARLRAQTPNCPVLVGGRGTAPARRLLEAAGAHVTQDFDEAHRWARGGASSHA